MRDNSSNQLKNILTNLRGCINPYFIIDNTLNSSLEIIEPKNGQILTIEDAHYNTSFCISLDKERTKGEFDKALPFLNSEQKGLTKKSDAILFHYRDNTLYIIIIELKNKRTDYKQIKSSFLFSDYIIKLVNLHTYNNDIKNIEFIGIFALQQKAISKDLFIDNTHTDFPIILYGEPTLKISRIIGFLQRNYNKELKL